MPGCQFAGVVVEVGSEAEDHDEEAGTSLAQHTRQTASDVLTPALQIGDHVLGACRFGSYATCLNVPAQQVLWKTYIV